MSPPCSDDWVHELAAWLNEEDRLPDWNDETQTNLEQAESDDSTDWFHAFSLSALLSAAQTQPQRHVGRTVWKAHYLPEPGHPQTIYIKAQWEWSYRPPKLSRLICRDWRQPAPVRELMGLQQAASLGLNVPEILFHERRHPLSAEAVLVTKSIPVSLPLSDFRIFIQQSRDSETDLTRMMQALGDTIASIHREGWVWRGMHAKHLFPQWDDQAQHWKFWLIDCEGFHRQLTGQHQQRDLIKLWDSCRDAGLTNALIAQAKQHYERSLTQPSEAQTATASHGLQDLFEPIVFPAEAPATQAYKRKAA